MMPFQALSQHRCTCPSLRPRCFAAPHSACQTAHSSNTVARVLVVVSHLTARAPRPIRRLHRDPPTHCSRVTHTRHGSSRLSSMPSTASSRAFRFWHHQAVQGLCVPPGPCRPLGKQGRFPTSCRSGRCLLRSMRAPPPSKSVASICSSCSPGSSGDCHRRTVET